VRRPSGRGARQRLRNSERRDANGDSQRQFGRIHRERPPTLQAQGDVRGIIKDAKKHTFFMSRGQKAKLKSAMARKRNKRKQRGFRRT
jgi:ribosomal protein S21